MCEEKSSTKYLWTEDLEQDKELLIITVNYSLD